MDHKEKVSKNAAIVNKRQLELNASQRMGIRNCYVCLLCCNIQKLDKPLMRKSTAKIHKEETFYLEEVE